ncbi:D-glucuronyl C5-epimerase B [Phlebotomus argentipes]|uniref:D-glucuronyl C5-epimerase B n=1 Tax=Phlebotomus argentipes TaxID=94469 RepID=UPI0028937525|nr:D-glucuronyl C5-epimerase B [Phlebotomus argentipes]
MMRLNLKFVLGLLCLVVLATFSLWTQCGDSALGRSLVPKWDRRSFSGGQQQPDQTEEIDCFINQEYTISCRKEGDEVYLPFSFLHKYFEVYGSLSTVDGTTRFDWAHSYGKVNYPKSVYDPRGIFMYFENYNVEMRDRVKCITASEGVPISTQWESQGYFYPTQIAQFGLSHYSKNLTEPEPRRKVVEDADKYRGEWVVPRESVFRRQFDGRVSSTVVQFATGGHLDSAVNLPMDHVLDLVLSLDLQLRVNSTFTVSLQHRETKKDFHIHYIVSDLMLSVQEENVYYGLGMGGVDGNGTMPWKHLTRDLLVDLQKGVPSSGSVGGEKRRKLRRTEIKITRLSFVGAGSFDNITLSTSEHIAHFYDAAEWFVRHQDATTGGWANSVRRRLGSGFAELPVGWYSAMGQGHAISLLARAYHHSRGDTRFLRAAIDGLKPFRVPAYQGGVLATFLGKYAWYEEYPTSPPSFVLNGFIYSLLGLYDLNCTAPQGHSAEAGVLFEQGMSSLKRMLLLFDTGSGTSYDLRHFTLGIAPNLARWDYHATHVNQLLLLATIDRDPVIEQTAKRWQGYMVGKRAQHN